MKIGWVHDYPSFAQRPGGAQRAVDIYLQTAPPDVVISPCIPGSVDRDCDAYILFLTKNFSVEETEFLMGKPFLRCGFDWWHPYEPMSRYRNGLIAAARANVWVSPLHLNHSMNRFGLEIQAHNQFVIPPPMDLTGYQEAREALEERNNRAFWAAEWHPYKAPDLAAEWALKNRFPLDLFCPIAGEVTITHPFNPFVSVKGFVPEEERLATWAQYSRFVHFNRYPDAFAYTLLEAHALGCEVVVSGYTGVESFQMDWHKLTELCIKAPEEFWKLAGKVL